MKNILVISSPILEKSKEDIIAETFLREKSKLLNFIKRRIPKADDAEDILQDVFGQLIENFDVLRPIEQITAWIFRVARNKIIDRYRKKKTESLEKVSQVQNDEHDAPQFFEKLFDPFNNPEDEMMRNLIWSTLMGALNEMPELQKNVFVMHELEEKSFKEISGLTGAGVNTLLSRKRYAILFLREKLQELYQELNN